MKRLITSILFITLVLNQYVSAQTYSVVDVIEMQNDLTARTTPRKDPSGKDCALLRVNIPSAKTVHFSDSIGEVRYLPGEFDVYIAEGAPRIGYIIHGSEMISYIDFSDFGINIKGKTVYKVTLKPDSSVTNIGGTLTISANVDGAIVLIDGKPSGQIPVTVSDLSEGEHIISIPNTMGYTCPEQKIIIKNNEHSSLKLNLEKTEYIGLGLPVLDDYDGEGYMARYKSIEKNGKVGLADLTGKVVVPCEYGWVYPDNAGDGFFAVGFDDTGNTFIDRIAMYRIGKGLVTNYYRSISYDCYAPNDYVAPWLKAEKIVAGNLRKVGYIDNQGREIVPFIFDEGTRYPRENKSSMIIASYKDDKGNRITGVYDSKGNVIVAPRAAEQCEFHDGVSVGRYINRRPEGVSYRFFIMDESGKETILPKELFIEGFMSVRFENGLLAVRDSNHKWGYVNHDGKLVIPCQYDEADSFESGYAEVKKDGRWMIINKKGEIIVDDSLVVSSLAGSYLVVTDGKLFGLMDENGIIRIPIKYDEISKEHYITATANGETSVFDTEANYLFSIPDNLNIDGRSRDGIIVLHDDETGAIGFANEKGDILGDCIYSLAPPPFDPDQFTGDDADPDYEYYQMTKDIISEGMIMLVLGDHFGFMDKTGKVTVPAVYTAALPFENGSAFVRKQDGTWLKIDKNNNILL